MKFSIDIKEMECVPHFTDRDDPEWSPEVERQEVIQWDEIDSKCNVLRASLLDETEPMAMKRLESVKFFRDNSGHITRERAAAAMLSMMNTVLTKRVAERLISQAASTSPSTAASPAPPPGPASC